MSEVTNKAVADALADQRQAVSDAQREYERVAKEFGAHSYEADRGRVLRAAYLDLRDMGGWTL